MIGLFKSVIFFCLFKKSALLICHLIVIMGHCFLWSWLTKSKLKYSYLIPLGIYLIFIFYPLTRFLNMATLLTLSLVFRWGWVRFVTSGKLLLPFHCLMAKVSATFDRRHWVQNCPLLAFSGPFWCPVTGWWNKISTWLTAERLSCFSAEQD